MKIPSDIVLHDLVDAKWLPALTNCANVLAAFAEVWKNRFLDTAWSSTAMPTAPQARPVQCRPSSIPPTLDRFLTNLKRLACLSGTEGLDLSDKGAQGRRCGGKRPIRDRAARSSR